MNVTVKFGEKPARTPASAPEWEKSDFPSEIWPLLGNAAYDLVYHIVKMPGGQEMLNAETARRKAAQKFTT